MRRVSLGVILFLCSSVTIADTSSLNLNMPNTSRTFQQDRIRAGNVDCSMAIGSATTVEFGVVGIVRDDYNPYAPSFAQDNVPLDPDNLTKDVQTEKDQEKRNSGESIRSKWVWAQIFHFQSEFCSR